MALGHSFEIVSRSQDPQHTARFLRENGWQNVEARLPVAGTRLTDGVIFVSLEAGADGETMLRYFNDSLDAATRDLTAAGVVPSTEGRTLRFVDPNDLHVEIVEAPKALTLKGEGQPVTKFGQFGELSLECTDVKSSYELWSKLGFRPTQYNPDPVVSWASLTDGLLNLGLYGKGHTKHMFRGAVITYFNQDMGGRLRDLKQSGVRFAQELEPDEPQNAVLEAPNRQMFFLFSY